MLTITDNPVMDAERYQAAQEVAQENREYIKCDECDGKIYKADDRYEGDNYYSVHEVRICEDCINKFWKECS